MTPNSTLELVETSNIQSKIYTIRGVQVMLDSELAKLYDVETKVFNQAVKRNINRFPENFRFLLTQEEYENLRSQFVTSSMVSNQYGGRRYLPYVFTEQGVSMLSAILKSDTAIDISIKIINSFVNMRKFISNNANIFQRLDSLESKQLQYKIETDDKFHKIFEAIEQKELKPSKGIFYDGQIFDAHNFISDLIRSAKSSIMLVDNYIDDTTLTLFAKNQNIKVTLFTHTITKQLQNDLNKYNSQYNKIELKTLKNSHDRFLIIDEKEIYHIGASLKDLGKKWFGFSRFESDSFGLIEKLKESKQ